MQAAQTSEPPKAYGVGMNPNSQANLQHAGRPAGTSNKITRTIKEAIVGAFDELGGMAYLVEVGRKDPKTFIGILSKIIPIDLKAALAIDPDVQATSSDRELAMKTLHLLASALQSSGAPTPQAGDTIDMQALPMPESPQEASGAPTGPETPESPPHEPIQAVQSVRGLPDDPAEVFTWNKSQIVAVKAVYAMFGVLSPAGWQHLDLDARRQWMADNLEAARAEALLR